MNRPARFVFLSLLVTACAAPRPVTVPVPAKTTAPRAEEPVRESDEYTRYELLAPESASFHILFEVTAVTPGATVYFNPIRKGSTASGETVTDRASSQPLKFEVVSGAEARTSGLPEADLATDYIRVHLPRPVPAEGGGVRLMIEKTYADAKSYFRKGADRIVFTRTLGIRRNSIVLPAGYEPVACNAPAQMLSEPDGRVTVSFMHPGPDAFPLTIEARKIGGAKAVASSEKSERLSERAHQDRTIVYFLREPESHSFDLYHDYTETRPGIDRYLNVVRPGSTASNPAARNLDTGETLRVETMKGDAVLASGPAQEEGVKPDDDVVVAHFGAVPPGGSVRLRISETYTDPKSYRLEGDDLVFDRTFGRPRNAVVLPAGWSLTTTSIPATVTETPDGRIRLDFANNRPDEIAVLIRARRRGGA
ncbi:MAG TPA: hypothetical protein VH988_22860 [Thermoanaerobaculia bacterium]|jgi:hypothetical protein|nr:hypothetical protein [Thermoanaerobaculia bacterium]